MKNLLAKKVKKNNKGFTLVELIIVIAIIAILVAVLAPNYVKYVDRSRWSSDRNDCESLLSEVKTAIVETQNNGGTVTAGTMTVSSGTTSTALQTAATNAGIKNALDDADPSWSQVKIKHKQDQSLPGETTKEKYNQFTITITESGAKGVWSSIN